MKVNPQYETVLVDGSLVVNESKMAVQFFQSMLETVRDSQNGSAHSEIRFVLPGSFLKPIRFGVSPIQNLLEFAASMAIQSGCRLLCYRRAQVLDAIASWLRWRRRGRCLVASDDLRSLGLLDRETQVLLYIQSEWQFWDRKRFEKTYGFAPRNFWTYLALTGGLPGLLKVLDEERARLVLGDSPGLNEDYYLYPDSLGDPGAQIVTPVELLEGFEFQYWKIKPKECYLQPEWFEY